MEDQRLNICDHNDLIPTSHVLSTTYNTFFNGPFAQSVKTECYEWHFYGVNAKDKWIDIHGLPRNNEKAVTRKQSLL